MTDSKPSQAIFLDWRNDPKLSANWKTRFAFFEKYLSPTTFKSTPKMSAETKKNVYWPIYVDLHEFICPVLNFYLFGLAWFMASSIDVTGGARDHYDNFSCL